MRLTKYQIGTMLCLFATLVAATALLAGSAEAAQRKFLLFPLDEFELAQGDEEYGLGEDAGPGAVFIRPRQAARIAKSAYPGSRVLNVKLLPSGVYAVTLRGNGRLTRVMVDGESGDIL